MGTQRQVGVAVAAATVLSVAVVVVFDGGPAELVFMLLLLVPLALVLRHVIVAARLAREEGRMARRLAAADPRHVAADAVAAERVRLTLDIQTAVRVSVTEIRALAVAAVHELPADPRASLETIAEHGRHAMTDLRRLLGLLRETPPPERPVEPPTDLPVPRIHRTDVVIGVIAVVDAVMWIVGDRFGFVAEPVTVVGLVLTGMAAGTALLRTITPGLGAVVLASVMACGTVLDRPVGDGVGLAAIFLYGGLVWACAARERSVRWAVAGPIAVTAAVVHKHTTYLPENLQIMLTVIAVASVAGLVLRVARRRATRATTTADSRRAELDEAVREARAAERRTVARDLHDGVSGGVGVIVMQAGAAAALWASDQPRARHALDVVVTTCHTTLLELDQLLVELTGRAAEHPSVESTGSRAGVALDRPAERGPSDVTTLVERMRGAGLDVTVTLGLPPRPVLGSARWSVAYRVVQESLTNVLRHAPGAHVILRVRETGDALDVEVGDDGPGSPSTLRRGYGLVGLSERVEQVGGTLTAGPGPDGGFRVRAHIPHVRRSDPAGHDLGERTPGAAEGRGRR